MARLIKLKKEIERLINEKHDRELRMAGVIDYNKNLQGQICKLTEKIHELKEENKILLQENVGLLEQMRKVLKELKDER